jgi:hypothetical protein
MSTETTMTITEIRVKMDEILEAKQHWKKYQDGSYELSLSEAGFYKLLEQYEKLLLLEEK